MTKITDARLGKMTTQKLLIYVILLVDQRPQAQVPREICCSQTA